ncbi:MAG: hypothetical protein MJY60_05950, partial [Bacteroidales bacterium]|nr:hypothetical protein [Bacteroidales bacterium]
MKALKKTLIALLLVAILLPVAAAVALYFPKVQTYAVQKVTEYLSKNIDGDISVGSVNIIPFNTVVLGDFCVKEPDGDTILSVDKLSANLDGKTLWKREELIVNRIALEGGKANVIYVAPGETNVSRLLSQFSSDKEKETSLPWDKISLKQLKLSGIDFVLDNPFAEGGTPDGSIDFNHLNVSGLELKAADLSWSGKKQAVKADLKNISFKEKNSGMHLDRLSARLSADKESVKVKGLHFSDGISDLTADCEIETTEFLDFNAIKDNLPLSLRLKESTVDLATISRFVPALAGKDLKLKVAGRFSGSLDDLRAKNLKIVSDSGKTVMDLDADIKGLPDLDRAVADLTLRNCRTNTDDIAHIIKSFNSDFKESTISRYAPDETIRLNGTVKGPLSDFLADISVETDNYGSLDADVNCKGITASSPSFAGRIAGNSLALGKVLGKSNIGMLSFDGDMDVTVGKQINAKVKELNINRLGFKGYEYGGITVSGTMQDNCINAYITDSDPNLKLKGDIFADLSGRKSKYYRADIDLTQANLSALHFDKRDTSLIKGHINADIEQRDGSVFLGRAELGELKVRLSEGKLDLGDIALNAFYDGEGEYNIDLGSAMADATYKGSSSISDLVSDVKAILGREMGNLVAFSDSRDSDRTDDRGCTFSLRTGDIKPLASFIMPDLFISEGTTVKAEMNGDNSVKIDAKSSLIQLKDNYIRNLTLKADGDKGPIRADIRADAIQSGQFILRNNKVSA